MTPDQVFALANPLALVGWLLLGAGVALNRPFLRDRVAGRAVPLLLCLLYVALLAIALPGAAGGFDSLANVERLFADRWLLLAGWVHYLAFDLVVGAWVARQAIRRGLPRAVLILLLPLTFLFGPLGLLASALVVGLARRPAT